MELIYSSVLPVKFPKSPNFRTAFERQMVPSDEMLIATGYVSEDSLMELKAILDHYRGGSKKKICDLVIGMHGREGFTQTQYDAARSLGEFLRENRIGEVRVCTAFKFHGKVYSFLKSTKPVASIVGSSNLSNLLGTDLQWETDTLVTERPFVSKLVGLHHDLVGKATQPLLDLADIKLVAQPSLLKGQIGVEEVPNAEWKIIECTKTDVEFRIPLKATPKSNLNAYFGKGRESSSTGAIRPRPWYEAELIVPKSITASADYPEKDRPFTVYTDDGWKFKCKVSGDYKKNLRSYDDLQTLGRWIKGRMESVGALKVGQPVTEEVLESYGASELLFSATKDPHVWLLDFSRKSI